MNVNAFTCLERYIFGELIFGRDFVLVSRGAYIRGGLIFGGGLYSGFYGIRKVSNPLCEKILHQISMRLPLMVETSIEVISKL